MLQFSSSPQCIVMVKLQFSRLAVKLVSHLWFGLSGGVMDTSAWRGGGRWGLMEWWRGRLLDEAETEVMSFWAPEVVECRQEPEMIPRNKSFSLAICSLTCTSTLRCQIIQLMEDNKDSDDGIIRFMTFFSPAVLSVSFWPEKLTYYCPPLDTKDRCKTKE